MKQDFISLYKEYTKETECPETFIIWSAFFIISSILDSNCFIQFKRKIYPNLYIILLAAPGARKGTTIKIAKNLLEKNDILLNNYSKENKKITLILPDLFNLLKDGINLIKINDVNYVTLFSSISPTRLYKEVEKDLFSRTIFIPFSKEIKRKAIIFNNPLLEKLKRQLSSKLQEMINLKKQIKMSIEWTKKYYAWYYDNSIFNDALSKERKALYIIKLSILLAINYERTQLVENDFIEALNLLTENEKQFNLILNKKEDKDR